METGFAAFFAQFDVPYREAAEQVIDVGLSWMAELLPPVLLLVIVWCGVRMASGTLHMGTFLKYAVRVVLLMFLVSERGYVDFVATPALDTVPNEIAHRILGVGAGLNAVEQFDIIDATVKEMVVTAWGNATGLFNIGNQLAIWNHELWHNVFHGLMFYVWMAMRALLYMVVMSGAFLLAFIPFDSTVSYVRTNIGKMVGLTVWQLCAAIVLKVGLNGTQIMLDRVTQGQTTSIAAQIQILGDVWRWELGVLVTFILMPAAAGVGSGIAASSSVVQGMIVGAATTMGSVGMRAAGAVSGRVGGAIGHGPWAAGQKAAVHARNYAASATGGVRP